MDLEGLLLAANVIPALARTGRRAGRAALAQLREEERTAAVRKVVDSLA
jgi:hypothetical protein